MSWKYPHKHLPADFHDGNGMKLVEKWLLTRTYPQDMSLILLVLGLVVRDVTCGMFVEGEFDEGAGVPMHVWHSPYGDGDLAKLGQLCAKLLTFLKSREGDEVEEWNLGVEGEDGQEGESSTGDERKLRRKKGGKKGKAVDKKGAGRGVGTRTSQRKKK